MGGTKVISALGTSPQDVRKQLQIPTEEPNQTLANVITFFQEEAQEWPLAGIGVGCFGPLDLDTKSTTYGYITLTPKAKWQNTDVVGPLAKAFGLPIAFDTDVNAAAMGEHKWGAARGLDNFIYITVGTGIGGGAMANGQLVHGLIHPEMGHMLIPHDRQRDPFSGLCRFHEDCLEGLASGPAMQARWGLAAENLPPQHEGWQLEADYLSYALANLILAYSPQRLIVGGGVFSQPRLLSMIWEGVPKVLNGYVHSAKVESQIDQTIVPAELGSLAGVLGAIALAQG